jgi:hypothetical protein
VQFGGLRDVRPQVYANGWPQLSQALSRHHVREDKTSGGLWSPVTYKAGTTRGNNNVEYVYAFVADLDGIPLDAVRPRLAGLEWHAYTTHSHTDSKPSWHVVIPLAQPVKATQWRTVWSTIRAHLKVGDESTCDASRAYFLPQRHPSRTAAVESSYGAWLDWTTLPRVAAAPRTARRTLPNGKTIIEWDDVEEPAELVGLTGNELITTALTYLRRIRAA